MVQSSCDAVSQALAGDNDTRQQTVRGCST